jgi:hypothetical protein
MFGPNLLCPTVSLSGTVYRFGTSRVVCLSGMTCRPRTSTWLVVASRESP